MLFDDRSPCVAPSSMISAHCHEDLLEPFKVLRQKSRGPGFWPRLQQLDFAGSQKTAIARKDSVELLRVAHCTALT
jgi:hypothetical protein